MKCICERPLSLRLFINDREPLVEDTADQYEEPSGGGYAPITLAPRRWFLKTSDASYARQTFKLTGPVGTVRGYFVTRVADNAFVCAARFEDAVEIPKYGGQIS
ncbi:MAG: hypothetical protein ACREUU_18690, partial [Gammaproteobacteria bacterium]